MDIMRKFSAIVFVCCNVFFYLGYAQTANDGYPVIGQRCPDFTLNEVDYYVKEKVSLTDFKGKWLILDFWTKNCSSCVKFFPTANELQREFKDHLIFLLVGKNDERWNKGIRSLFERYRSHYNLNLSSAYDTALFTQFGVYTVSHLVIVDPNGQVYSITDSHAITREKIKDLVGGRKPFFLKKANILESAGETPHIYIDNSKPLLVDGNGGDGGDFLYRSLISRWDIHMDVLLPPIDKQVDKGFFQGTGFSVEELYKTAYLGWAHWPYEDSLYEKFYPNVVLELKDRDTFYYNYISGQGLYNYSLKIPESIADKRRFQKIMQNDLDNFFGYEVLIEKREMPYWSLVLLTNGSKIKLQEHREEPAKDTADLTGFVMNNIQLKNVLWHIHSYHYNEPPFINETGINERISFSLNALMTDLSDVKKALRVIGFDLIKGSKRMGVLVIRPVNKEF